MHLCGYKLNDLNKTIATNQAIIFFIIIKIKLVLLHQVYSYNFIMLRDILQQVYHIENRSIECLKIDCQKLWKAQHLFTFSIHIPSIPPNLHRLNYYAFHGWMVWGKFSDQIKRKGGCVSNLFILLFLQIIITFRVEVV